MRSVQGCGRNPGSAFPQTTNTLTHFRAVFSPDSAQLGDFPHKIYPRAFCRPVICPSQRSFAGSAPGEEGGGGGRGLRCIKLKCILTEGLAGSAAGRGGAARRAGGGRGLRADPGPRPHARPGEPPAPPSGLPIRVDRSTSLIRLGNMHGQAELTKHTSSLQARAAVPLHNTAGQRIAVPLRMAVTRIILCPCTLTWVASTPNQARWWRSMQRPARSKSGRWQDVQCSHQPDLLCPHQPDLLCPHTQVVDSQTC